MIPHGTLVLTFRGSSLFQELTDWGDMPYGAYVWPSTVEQIVALKFGRPVPPGIVIAVSLAVTCPAPPRG